MCLSIASSNYITKISGKGGKQKTTLDSPATGDGRVYIPSYQAVGRLFDEVYGYLARFGVNGLAGAGAAIWHDNEYKTSDIDGEAVVYLKQPVPESGHVKVYELPAATMASVIHKGTYNTFNRAYEALGRWIEANGYKIVGPNREIYLYLTQPVHQDDDSYVTEIQFPVAKIEPGDL
jgi:effector-binding domain-containing protein